MLGGGRAIADFADFIAEQGLMNLPLVGRDAHMVQ
jgi:hypothetical protein